MRKTFCDACGDEVGGIGQARIIGPAKLVNIGDLRVSIEVIKLRAANAVELAEKPSTKKVANGMPDLCSGCIFLAVDQLDQRPEAGN